jgi:hypothetical protein
MDDIITSTAAQNDEQEIEKIVDDFIDQPLSDEDLGASLVAQANMYMKLKTAANKRYSDTMTEVISQLEELDKLEQAGMDDIDMAAAKSVLKP